VAFIEYCGRDNQQHGFGGSTGSGQFNYPGKFGHSERIHRANGTSSSTSLISGSYRQPDFLYGNLHHHGGAVFFLIGLFPLVLMLGSSEI
jgi:hypothetical protein